MNKTDINTSSFWLSQNLCICLSLALLLLTACDTATKPTPENYLKTLNAYLPDHPDCLLDGSIRFPYETSDPAKTKQMDALVKAQILAVTREPAIRISRYTQTPEGIRSGANLCYGYRLATEIVSSTPPAPANGFTETQVTYRYKLRDLPIWAKGDDVMAQFPTLAHEASGEATDTITLALDRVGWSVPN
jgi:hypothetical protein